jgi:hypothetical protein
MAERNGHRRLAGWRYDGAKAPTRKPAARKALVKRTAAKKPAARKAAGKETTRRGTNPAAYTHRPTRGRQLARDRGR